MKMRIAGWMERIGMFALAFAIVFLAGGAMASDVERQVPVIRDSAGSGLTLEISRVGTRQTATSILTLHNPTVKVIDDRIVRMVKMTTRSAAKEIPGEATSAGPLSRIGRPETALSSLRPIPGEISARGAHGFLKELRASRKEKRAPAAVIAIPDLRLGMDDTSRR